MRRSEGEMENDDKVKQYSIVQSVHQNYHGHLVHGSASSTQFVLNFEMCYQVESASKNLLA